MADDDAENDGEGEAEGAEGSAKRKKKRRRRRESDEELDEEDYELIVGLPSRFNSPACFGGVLPDWPERSMSLISLHLCTLMYPTSQPWLAGVC